MASRRLAGSLRMLPPVTIALLLGGCGVGATTVTSPAVPIGPPPSASGSVTSTPSASPSATATPGNVLEIGQVGLTMTVPGDVGELDYTIANASGLDGLTYQITFTTSTLTSAWAGDTACTQPTAELAQVSAYTQDPVDVSGQPGFLLLGQSGGYWLAITQSNFSQGCTGTTQALASHQLSELEQAVHQGLHP